MNELGDKYKLLKNTFDYYVGLAENAISWYHAIKVEYISQRTNWLKYGMRRKL